MIPRIEQIRAKIRVMMKRYLRQQGYPVLHNTDHKLLLHLYTQHKINRAVKGGK